MYDFWHFDQVLKAVENLSADDIDDGILEELSYYSATMASQWKISVSQMRQDLIIAGRCAGFDSNDSAYEVNRGLRDGLEAMAVFYRIQGSQPMKHRSIASP